MTKNSEIFDFFEYLREHDLEEEFKAEILKRLSESETETVPPNLTFEQFKEWIKK